MRLGPARAPAGASPAASRQRAVRATFTRPSATYEVFKACKALWEQHKVFVDRDLTVQQRAVRTALKEDYKALRENGYRPFWRSEKLFYGAGDARRATLFRPGSTHLRLMLRSLMPLGGVLRVFPASQARPASSFCAGT